MRNKTGRDGDLASIEIRVQGPGIPREKQGQIFERFERASDSRAISGLGLGLFIVRQIVHAHSGFVRVESEPGSGAWLIVELPLSLPETAKDE